MKETRGDLIARWLPTILYYYVSLEISLAGCMVTGIIKDIWKLDLSPTSLRLLPQGSDRPNSLFDIILNVSQYSSHFALLRKYFSCSREKHDIRTPDTAEEKFLLPEAHSYKSNYKCRETGHASILSDDRGDTCLSKKNAVNRRQSIRWLWRDYNATVCFSLAFSYFHFYIINWKSCDI